MKLTATLSVLSLSLCCAAAGCGGISDLFGVDGGTTVYKLVPGMYKVTDVTIGQDACAINPTDPADPITKLTFKLDNPNTGIITLEGFGSGEFTNNVGKFRKTGASSDAEKPCVYMYTADSSLTVTSNNTFTMAYTENQTGRSGCVKGTQPTCSSNFTYKWTIAQ